MSKKKVLIYILVTLIGGTIVFLIINNFIGKEDIEPNNSNSNTSNVVETKGKETIVIDYSMYQELRSEIYEDDTFAIILMNSEDEVSKTFKEEILYSFKDRNSKVYELDTNKLNDTELSSVITDITDIMGYDKPTIVTPTLIVSKKGKIVYKQAGLTYSPDITSHLDEEGIK